MKRIQGEAHPTWPLPANHGGGGFPPPRRLSKKWLAPLFRGVHSSLAPTARPGSYARKPLLRKAFCGFDAHVAKSDQSLRGLRPPNPRGFFDRLGGGGFPPPRRAWYTILAAQQAGSSHVGQQLVKLGHDRILAGGILHRSSGGNGPGGAGGAGGTRGAGGAGIALQALDPLAPPHPR